MRVAVGCLVPPVAAMRIALCVLPAFVLPSLGAIYRLLGLGRRYVARPPRDVPPVSRQLRTITRGQSIINFLLPRQYMAMESPLVICRVI